MVDFGKFSNYDEKCAYDMIRFGAGVPITEAELNETQQIIDGKIRSINRMINKPGFIGDGELSFADGRISLKNQYIMTDTGKILYIDKLEEVLGAGMIAYVDIYKRDQRYTDTIKQYGNAQSTVVLDNNMFDPRIGKETTMRIQYCYNIYIGSNKGTVTGHTYIPIASYKDGKFIDLREINDTVSDTLANIKRNLFAGGELKRLTVTNNKGIVDINECGNGFAVNAKLYGNTVQNLLVSLQANKSLTNADFSGIEGSEKIYYDIHLDKDFLKKNTTYTLVLDVSRCSIVDMEFYAGKISDTGTKFKDLAFLNSVNGSVTTGRHVFKLNTLDDFIGQFNTKFGYFGIKRINVGKLSYSLMLLEGDWSDKDIPKGYFDGLLDVNGANVRVIGKNILNIYDPNIAPGCTSPIPISQFMDIDNGSVTVRSSTFELPNGSNYTSWVLFPVRVKPNTKYTISFKSKSNTDKFGIKVLPANISSGLLHWNNPTRPYTEWTQEELNEFCNSYENASATQNGKLTFDSKEFDVLYIGLYGYTYVNTTGSPVSIPNSETVFSDIQVEEADSSTAYEEYRECVQGVGLSLRSIGNIRDEIDLDKGKLIRRVGMINFNGYGHLAGAIKTETIGVNMYPSISGKLTNVHADKLITLDIAGWREQDVECIVPYIDEGNGAFGIGLYIHKSKLSSFDLNGITEYLKTNPVKVLYELDTPVIEDIDTSSLRLFDKAKHVILSPLCIVKPDFSMEYSNNTRDIIDTTNNNLCEHLDVDHANENFLMNSYFVSPINQRNQLQYVVPANSKQYSIDRWLTYTTSGEEIKIIPTDIGLSIKSNTGGTARIRQWIDKNNTKRLIGKTVTFSCRVMSNNARIDFNISRKREESDNIIYTARAFYNVKRGDILSFTFNVDESCIYLGVQMSVFGGEEMIIEWAKLELGNKPTPLRPKLYDTELIECMKYFRIIGNGGNDAFIAQYIKVSDKAFEAGIRLDIPMRIRPTVKMDKTYFRIRDLYGQSGIASISTLSTISNVNISGEISNSLSGVTGFLQRVDGDVNVVNARIFLDSEIY